MSEQNVIIELEPATKSQLWALFCATREDHREKNLTKKEAGDLLNDLNKERLNYSKIFLEAMKLATKNVNEFKPTPMIVQQHQNMLDDNSPVVKQYHVSEGLCGFAYVIIPYSTKENRQLINQLKKLKVEYISKNYGGGFLHAPKLNTQSIERKEEYCSTMISILQKNNISCYMESRLD